MTHKLKIAPKYFDDVESGRKPFEFRKNDRDFRVGDILILQEWSTVVGYTGRETTKQITYVLLGGVYGIPYEYCILGIAQVELYALLKNIEDGMLFKMPCKIGDTLYMQGFDEVPDEKQNDAQRNVGMVTYLLGMKSEKIKELHNIRPSISYTLAPGLVFDIPLKSITDNMGKNIFLTREAAEKSLNLSEKESVFIIVSGEVIECDVSKRYSADGNIMVCYRAKDGSFGQNNVWRYPEFKTYEDAYEALMCSGRDLKNEVNE